MGFSTENLHDIRAKLILLSKISGTETPVIINDEAESARKDNAEGVNIPIACREVRYLDTNRGRSGGLRRRSIPLVVARQDSAGTRKIYSKPWRPVGNVPHLCCRTVGHEGFNCSCSAGSSTPSALVGLSGC
ncbi:hypothetical protein M9H77_12764 [Catharanthus roseus]|uniref:Uncharacterized protein n=1 Tax=Catharanthus roseus TaxID=4058 RepID=A0ACC0BIB6_CATRO|nr:hypothetical protein M9H77_12764 [Catharanthus roseus]